MKCEWCGNNFAHREGKVNEYCDDWCFRMANGWKPRGMRERYEDNQ